MSRRQIRAAWRARLRQQDPTRVAPQPAPRISPPARISLHIAELHMQSFGRSEAIRIADGLQQELSSILARDGVPRPWLRASSIESMRLSDIRLRPAGKSQAIAQHLAQALVQAQTNDRGARK